MLFVADATYVPATVLPPAPPREFRGAWIATVANLDWPSKPGLSVAEQKAELIALLDRAVQLKLNAVIFQVRPMADTVYASPLEPWSEFLTGTMGKAPQPFYDPLAFAIAEAHKRGLELHAWFNPFRASLPPTQARSPVALDHISRTHPELVRRYGDLLWLDPGEPAARQHVLDVIMDVVRRYGVDGVTFDDYFYPYPETDTAGSAINFPDDASWRKYGVPSGMSRDEWRRANVNQFVQNAYHSIHALKPWVKFGISPFGIWRPGFPKQVQGLDAYAKIYADSRKWLANGWLDYFSPQLYWPVDSPQQNFFVLLNWWAQQNVKHRQLWPSLDAVNVGTKWKPDEIAWQIQIVRRQPGADGEIFYHLRNLLENRALANVIRAQYSQPALVPASPWLGTNTPARPIFFIGGFKSGILHFLCRPGTGGDPTQFFVLQIKSGGQWSTEILPGSGFTRVLGSEHLEVIAVTPVGRFGNAGQPVVYEKSTLAPLEESASPPMRQDDKKPSLNWQRGANR